MRKLLIALIFLLLALPAAAETWYFAVVGDTQGASVKEPVSPVFDKVIERVNKLKPDFLVHLGDSVCGSGDPKEQKRQFLFYRQKAAGLNVPVYQVPGNHDLPSAEDYPVYQEEVYPRRYYSFDHKGAHFVVLSSEERPGLSGGLGGEQLRWLEDDLKQNEAASKTEEGGPFPVFVFIHRPLYRGVIHPYILGDAGALERILQSHKVRYLFAGHEHRFGIAHQGGLTEYISGGGGAPLLNFSEEAGGFYHFLMVKVENGKPEVDFIKIEYPKTYQDFGNLFKAYRYLKKSD